MNNYTPTLLLAIQQRFDNGGLPSEICKEFSIQPSILSRLRREGKLKFDPTRPRNRDWTSFLTTLNEVGLEEAIKIHNTSLSSVRTAVAKGRLPRIEVPRKKGYNHYSIEELQAAVELATCVSDVTRMLDITQCTFNITRIQQLCKEHDISMNHFDVKASFRRNKESWEFADIFCDNSGFDRTRLRPAAIKHGLYTGICSECGVGEQYNNKPLTIELDHINGKCRDNRMENLRWLCPNCHSQTPTFKKGAK